VVIIISILAIISVLVLIFLILSPAKPILLASFPKIFFLATLVNPIILSHRLIYYRDHYPRLLY
jgi:hypothetical protein